MSERVDVLVIGGGPAGLAAGIQMASDGLRTLVCDSRPLPADKPCGEGIMPTGVAHLERLGVARHLGEADSARIVGLIYRGPSGIGATAEFAEGPGLGVRRTALSRAFLSRAKELDCLEIRDGTKAEPIGRDDDGVSVRVGDQRISARLLVGADGLSSRVRRWAGLEGAPAPASRRRFGVRRHFAVAPWSDHVEVCFGPGVEAYVTPCGAQQVGVAFLWDRARCREVRPGRELFPSLLAAFPRLEERLRGAEPASETAATGPLLRNTTGPVADGVVLVGDAAGYLDAITGEGISLATAQALALERTVGPLLKRESAGMPSARELAAHARAHREIVAPYYRMTRLVLWLSRRPALAERAVAALAQDPTAFQHLLSANMGLASPWSLGVMRAIRLLISAVRPVAKTA